VLRGLGWNVMSVYIIDWLDNKDKVLGKIKAEIDAALERYRDPEAAPKAEEKKKQELVFETEKAESFDENFDEFKSFKIKALGTSESFNEASTAKITKCINDILAAEAPMNRKALAKKTFSCWGISRPGANMKALFDTAFEKSEAKVTKAGENEYVWLSSQIPEEYDKCRTVYKNDEKRDIDDVAPEEIAVGIKEIMSRQVAMSRDDLLREVAHLFGFTRMTATLETSVALGIKAAKNRGWVGFSEDGRVSYTGN
jgi:hypothetical protein